MSNPPLPSAGKFLLAHSSQAEIQGWYYDTNSAAGGTILQEAFQDGMSLLKQELDPDEFSRLRDSVYTARKSRVSQKAVPGQQQNQANDADTFAGVLAQAQTEYSRSRNSDSKAAQKARFWLGALATRIVHYGNIMDVLVQHHPEYVSLAWGAFKCLFTAVVNHEEILAKIAKHCVQIGDLLPQEKILLILYPTEEMRKAVALVYASIIKFIQQAVRFYKEGRLKHAVKALFQPWALRFQEVADELSLRSKRVTELAGTCAKAELRDMHLDIMEARETSDTIHVQVSTIQSVLGGLEALINQKMQDQVALLTIMHQEVKLDLSQQKRTIDQIHLNQLLSMSFWQQLPSSGECLEYCLSMRHRRYRRTTPYHFQPCQLEKWSQEPRSALIAIEGIRRSVQKDFLTDLALFIKALGLPVLWAFRFPNYWNLDLTIIDMIRMLVLQALQQSSDPNLTTEHPLTMSHLRDASTLQDWLNIWVQITKHLPRVFILLDGDLLTHASHSDRQEISDVVEKLRTQAKTSAKVMLPASGLHEGYIKELQEEGQSPILITCDDRKKPRLGRVRRVPKAHRMCETDSWR